MPKLPLPPPAAELKAVGGPDPWARGLPDVLWRIRRTSGRFPSQWNEFRYFGPLASARFDPHEPPPHTQLEGVAYLAGAWTTCFAEVFQGGRTVNVHAGSPYVTGVALQRPLHLLDLRGTWPIRIGASHHINTGRKDHCRAWARALRAAWPEADGFASVGIDSGLVVTLFASAADSFGPRPVFDRPLADSSISTWVAVASRRIGYDLV